MKIYVLTKEETFFEDGEMLETVITPLVTIKPRTAHLQLQRN